MTRLSELGILDRLALNPDESMLMMSKNIYETLAGTQLRKLSVYYSIMGFLAAKSESGSGVYLDYNRLLSKLIALGVTIDFKEACSAVDPSDLFVAVTRPDNIAALCEVSEGICNITGKSCTNDIVSKIACAYLHKLMISTLNGSGSEKTTVATWLSSMESYKPTFTKLGSEHSVMV